MIEVKGQWSGELFTAAAEQLDKRYTIHPDAAQQGIYLVLWFGKNEKIANKRDPLITNPEQLKERIIEKMPEDLHGRIDVYRFPTHLTAIPTTSDGDSCDT